MECQECREASQAIREEPECREVSQVIQEETECQECREVSRAILREEPECQEASRFLSREMPECHHGEILPGKIQIIISEKRKEIRLRPDFLEI